MSNRPGKRGDPAGSDQLRTVSETWALLPGRDVVVICKGGLMEIVREALATLGGC